MDQHPVPRQITTFEFKLIGFLTIKQFVYLALFIPIGIIVYYIFPVPLLNILFGVIVGGIGFALAFVPVNDRPMDVWIVNFIKRLTSPTQYFYQKNNEPLYFLKDLYFVSDPHRIMAHIESQEKLTAYLSNKKTFSSQSQKKQSINNLFNLKQSSSPSPVSPSQPKPPANTDKTSPPPAQNQPKISSKTPFFTGIIKNHKLIPIPGILIYIKDEKGNVLRLLKSNPHGVFATFNPLPPAEYFFEIKDPNNNYIFDTMKIKIEDKNQKPIEIFSKELL